MQKILIIYSVEGNLEEIANGIADGARKNGHQVEVVSTENTGRPISFYTYDLVLAGSPAKGFFKGKIAGDLRSFLKDCKRTGGQEAIAFVTPKWFGTNKAMKKVMGELESQGCIVKNFKSLKNEKQAVEFGKTL